jgi:hypothetical protein
MQDGRREPRDPNGPFTAMILPDNSLLFPVPGAGFVPNLLISLMIFNTQKNLPVLLPVRATESVTGRILRTERLFRHKRSDGGRPVWWKNIFIHTLPSLDSHISPALFIHRRTTKSGS